MTHKQFWMAVAAYYKQQLNDITISMYAADVSHISIDELMELFSSYRKDPKNKFMPMPSAFLAMLDPSLSIESSAELVAGRIHDAVVKFGWPSPEKARAYIGDVGWDIVRRRGGWQVVCENLGSEWDVGTFHAQSRNSAKASLESHSLGYYDEPIDYEQLTHDTMDRLGVEIKEIEHD